MKQIELDDMKKCYEEYGDELTVFNINKLILEIEQLKKEKEWLINKSIQAQFLTGLEMRKKQLIEKMQKALEEKK